MLSSSIVGGGAAECEDGALPARPPVRSSDVSAAQCGIPSAHGVQWHPGWRLHHAHPYNITTAYRPTPHGATDRSTHGRPTLTGPVGRRWSHRDGAGAWRLHALGRPDGGDEPSFRRAAAHRVGGEGLSTLVVELLDLQLRATGSPRSRSGIRPARADTPRGPRHTPAPGDAATPQAHIPAPSPAACGSTQSLARCASSRSVSCSAARSRCTTATAWCGEQGEGAAAKWLREREPRGRRWWGTDEERVAPAEDQQRPTLGRRPTPPHPYPSPPPLAPPRSCRRQ